MKTKPTQQSLLNNIKHLSVHPGNGVTEKEEKLERKVKPKSRSSTKGAAGNTSAKPAAVKASKYFQSPEEGETDSGDDFDMVTSAAPPVMVNAEKPEHEGEEDEDSEEDEDDWEEVEGEWGINK